MKRASLMILALAGSSTLGAQAMPQSPSMRLAPSGRGMSQVQIVTPRMQGQDAPAPKVIAIDYGQPHLRGRPLHTDSLVPYDKPWRTGANASTTFQTDVDIVMGGQAVPAGKYVVKTLPSRAGWKLMLQKDVGQGAMDYDAAHNVAVVDLKRRELASPIESLTMWLIPATGGPPLRGELRMAWGNVELSTDWQVK